MEWLTHGSLVFYLAAMMALTIIGWLTWNSAASRNGAHTREVISFFKSEYETIFFSRDMLVALFKQDFSGVEVTVKSSNGDSVVARLRYLSGMHDKNTIHFDVKGLTYRLNIDSVSTNRLSVLLEDGGYVCEYILDDNKKGLFSVNKSTVLETECGRQQMLVDGRYPVLQNGQIVGYIYSESNIFGHYAVILLLKSELPASVRALFLALETQRFGFAIGGRA